MADRRRPSRERLRELVAQSESLSVSVNVSATLRLRVARRLKFAYDCYSVSRGHNLEP